MAFDVEQQFDAYEITNGMFRERKKGGLLEAKKLGCTGKLEVETETRTIQKKCEGRVSKEVTRVEKLTGTFTGHVSVGVLRSVFGLTNDDLKQGVYAYKTTSVGGGGALTFDVFDMTRENKKLIAFPNVSFVSGLKFSLENGGDEVAEIELEFSAAADENNSFYYEAYEEELDTSLKTKWNKQFTSEGVLKATSSSGAAG